ncbi:MAG: glycosyltransferase family 9 protein [Vicinamibacteria bacterium]|nr:glycosyltransferase family 9 protein [Vicinamibacteria bacterium]
MTSNVAPEAIVDESLGPARWDWTRVRRVLVVRLRSIGDAVLCTPALRALRRHLPEAHIDLLLEDGIAPLFEGHPDVDSLIAVRRGSFVSRMATAARLRRRRYDVAFNLHGGTTATLLTWLSGAGDRVGFARYQFAWLHNHAAPAASLLWGRDEIHSVEEQLALLGFAGVPVRDRPPTRLHVSRRAAVSIAARLRDRGVADDARLALVHPAAAFDTKRWHAAGFARVVERLGQRGLEVAAVVTAAETHVIDALRSESRASFHAFSDLSLPEVAALAARSRLFVGNDSGIAHIAAAAGAPVVVVFGSSNVSHWRPWSRAPSAVVRHEMPCQPCPGYTCSGPEPLGCLRNIPCERVIEAVERVLDEATARSDREGS